MTSISASDIRHLAVLSGLALSQEEEKSLGGDLEKIINYINQLSELDVSGVEPTYQVTDLSNVFRDDEIEVGCVNRDQLLELSKEVEDSQIKVPKVL